MKSYCVISLKGSAQCHSCVLPLIDSALGSVVLFGKASTSI